MKSYFGFSSHTNRTLSEEELQRNALLSDLEQTKKALEIAYAGFDNVTEPDLIDCYIYEVNSVLKRYKFLMEQAAHLCMLPEEKNYCFCFKHGSPGCYPDQLSSRSELLCHR